MTRNERRNSILMTCHYPDVNSVFSDWSCCEGNWFQLIRRITHGWAVTRHQYGFSELVSQTSFRGETSRGVSKSRLFSQVTYLHFNEHFTVCLSLAVKFLQRLVEPVWVCRLFSQFLCLTILVGPGKVSPDRAFPFLFTTIPRTSY